ncbi:MAG: hypothetical protein IH614_12320 [Desulfuromonadales bacterium]|nr:hypothetical protein [Desulfuromonadales bacterium]
MQRVLKLLVLAVCGVALSVAGAAAKDEVLEKALAGLDRAYIPPLFYSSTPNSYPASVPAMGGLNAYWGEFRANYYNYRPDYETWKTYFDQIETQIDMANAALAGNNFPAMQTALQGVRKVLVVFRPNNGFPKFITDKLTNFHGPMEDIARTVADSVLTEEEILKIANVLPAASLLWLDVEKCSVDPAIWGFSPEQMSVLYALIAQERSNLNALAAALESGDNIQIKAAAQKVKPAFANVYKAFGNF